MPSDPGDLILLHTEGMFLCNQKRRLCWAQVWERGDYQPSSPGARSSPAGREQRFKVGNPKKCNPFSGSHCPKIKESLPWDPPPPPAMLVARLAFLPEYFLLTHLSLPQEQEGQRGTPGVYLLPVFPASCFPQTNELLRIEEVEWSGTQSRKLGAEVPAASGLQQWRIHISGKREAPRWSESLAVREERTTRVRDTERQNVQGAEDVQKESLSETSKEQQRKEQQRPRWKWEDYRKPD